MKRSLAVWLLLLGAMPGCIDRGRVNAHCEWTGDSIFPIDTGNPAHQQHLVADAQLAEELAIRYADAEHKRLFGYEGHGGLIDHGRVRNECMARLVTTITNNHAVTSQQVDAARGERDRLFDLGAALSFVPLYLFGAAVACRRLYRRFSSHERYAGLVATGVTSTVVSALGLQCGQLWLSVWEIVRVGNGHMSSFRAATQNLWPHQHVGELFVGGILLFWLIAPFCRPVAPDESVVGAAVFPLH